MTESTAEEVLIRVEGRLGHITLNRPKQINALTLDMVTAVRAALAAWRDDPLVEVLLIDGAIDNSAVVAEQEPAQRGDRRYSDDPGAFVLIVIDRFAAE